MTGRTSSEQRPDSIRFFLDEGLPKVVSESLQAVGHPITCSHEQGKLGWLDIELIPWLAGEGFVWITKDDDARKAHIALLKQHRLSVVWIRGLEGRKNVVSIKDIHLMLTVKLPVIERELARAREARHFCIYLHGEAVALHTIREDDIRAGQPLIRRSKRGRRS